jgi:type VI secretion system secreted protein Hcp
MAVDMFLKLDGIKGESMDSKHKDEIDVLAWSWGMTQSGNTHMGGGGGAGKVNVQDISFTKRMDAASPNLAARCAQGEHIKEALLTVRKAGTDQQEYIKLTLKDCLVSSISTGGSGGQDTLTENISLNFAEYKFEYWPQKKDGTLGGVVSAGYNIKENKKA